MNRYLLAASALAFVGAGGAAHAQNAAVLDEVVVTAERREANIQRTALSIAALQGDQVEQQVSRPDQLTNAAPALKIGATGGMTQIYVRGVGNLGVTSFAEGAIAFNVDQVYVGRPTALDGIFFDLERVEILKGPQGTLYGRNASGGAINLITTKPKPNAFGGRLNIEVGNYDRIKTSGAVNIPISDNLTGRAAFQQVSHSAYLSDGYNDQDTTAARVHLLYQPTDDLSLLLTGEYAHVGGQGDAAVPSFRTCGDWCGPSDPSNRALAKVGPFAALLSAPSDDGVGFHDDRFWSVSANLDWNLDFAKLSVIASHRESKIDSLVYPSLFRGRIHDASAQDSVEARLSSVSDGPLTWVVGLYAYQEDIDGDYDYSHGVALQAQRAVPTIENRSNAVFGQATYSVTDAFRLTAGLRYLRDEKSLTGLQYCSTGLFCGVPVGSGRPPAILVMNESGEWDNTSYRAGVEWDVASQSMLYANVSTGFKSGGFYPGALNAQFGPEDLTAYALGSKNRFFDGRLQLNAEAFWWDYKGHQESHVGVACIAAVGGNCVASGPIFLTENVGQAEIKGIDIDVEFALTSVDRLWFSVGYLDAVATDFTYNVPVNSPPPPTIACGTSPNGPLTRVDCSGNQMPRSPEWSGRAAYEHKFELASGASVVANVSTYFSDAYWTSIDFIPGTRQKRYTKSDASITWRAPDNRWSIGAWVDNIEDDAVSSVGGAKVYAGTPSEALLAPRTYGLRLTATFGAD